jgi:hypothetical protein
MMMRGLPAQSKARKASGSRIKNLSQPKTHRQNALAFIRWRKAHGGAVTRRKYPPWAKHLWLRKLAAALVDCSDQMKFDFDAPSRK